jgi:SAM-dependent methyltransferase
MGRPKHHTPLLEQTAIDRHLGELLNLDPLPDPCLGRRIDKLSERHRTYCRTVAPIWTPGVVITPEMRNHAENHLPVAEVLSLLPALLRRLCRFSPTPIPLTLPPPLSWPDLLARLPFHLQVADPCRLLSLLLSEPDARIPLLFALFIPRRFGGGLGRYPHQMAVVRQWLAKEAGSGRHLRCLDAACGTGEGTWELALSARAADIPRERLTIHGSSLGELELMAARHLFFPHDQQRQERMRQAAAPLVAAGYSHVMSFFRDDLLKPSPAETTYDLILCNGTMGGPFLHEPQQLETALAGLADRLRAGGLLCMADHFHGGWEKKSPRRRSAAVLAEMGLSIQCGNEGLVAVKES